jgi:hypothetical protein
VLDAAEVDLCHRSPGLPVDLIVNAELRALAEVWLGRQAFGSAVRARTITIEGPRALVRVFPTWLRLSALADIPSQLGRRERRSERASAATQE